MEHFEDDTIPYHTIIAKDRIMVPSADCMGRLCEAIHPPNTTMLGVWGSMGYIPLVFS